jgi:chemotaxis protein methyltransferase CheR
MNRDLTNTELSKVCKVIEDNIGLNFPVVRWDILGRNLASAAREAGFQNMFSFMQMILSNRLNKELLNLLAAHLTITETYFWREPEVFTALTDHILPEIVNLEKKGEKSINIWSSGCSSGEEPYSLAIALHRTIPDIKDWNISILATDINQKALNKAIAGIYGPWSFRNSPDWLIKGYFRVLADKKYEIRPEIKRMVTFGKMNLVRDKIPYPVNGAKPKDIIFCRNVLMYLSEKWVNKISNNLYNCLSDNGWFVVSSAELSSQVFHQFTPVNFKGAIIYRKTNKESLVSPENNDLATLELQSHDIQPLNSSTSEPFNPSTFQYSQSVTETPEKSHSTKKFTIHLLADQGYLTEALTLCNEAISSEKLVPDYYFLRASILQEMDKNNEAIQSLKQAIYLDPDYIMGYFALGNLLNKKGSEKNAKRYFNNVINLLKKYSDDDVLSDSDGLSVKYIREIIFANIESKRTK